MLRYIFQGYTVKIDSQDPFSFFFPHHSAPFRPGFLWIPGKHQEWGILLSSEADAGRLCRDSQSV